MLNGYHLLIQSRPQGYFFCQKWYIKGKGLNLGADPPCIKIYQVSAHQNLPPPPQPPLGKPDKKSRKKQFAPCTSHFTSCLPRQILHKHCLRFLLGPLKYPGKKRNTKVNAKYFGANKVYYGRCANLELDILRLFIKLNSSHGFV